MCSKCSHYTQEQAAEIVAKCGGASKACADTKALALALGAKHLSTDGRKIVWFSPCNRCGGAGSVYWGVCFRCGGGRSMTYERDEAAIAPIWRDLLAIADGKPAPSIVADEARARRANAKFAALDSEARAWATANGFAALVSGDDWRNGVWHSARDIARKAVGGMTLTEPQRALLAKACEVAAN